MSRVQIALPPKSNALRTPRPVITHTYLPSVIGDGVDMFCLRCMLLPAASGRFHVTDCFVRSIAHSSRSPVLVPVATFRKIVSPQMIGVDPLKAGNGSFHAIPLVSTFAHTVGDSGRPSKLLPAGRCPPRCISSDADGPPSAKPTWGKPDEYSSTSPELAQVALHVSGNPFSRLTPSCDGPRQCGQCCARPVVPARAIMRVDPMRIRMVYLYDRSACGV